MVISSVAVGLIWLMIFDPNIGPLNAIINSVGLTPPMLGWLGDPEPRNLDVPGRRRLAIHRLHDGAGPRRTAGRAAGDLPGRGARRRPRRPRVLVHHAAIDPQHPDRRRADHLDRRLQGLRPDLRNDARRPGERHRGARHLHLSAGLQYRQHGLRRRDRRVSADHRGRSSAGCSSDIRGGPENDRQTPPLPRLDAGDVRLRRRLFAFRAAAACSG